MNSLKKIQFICLTAIFILSGFSIAATNDYGNTSKQEYGDVVYNYLPAVIWGNSDNYNHAGLYAGINTSDIKRVIEAVGESSNAIRDRSFIDFINDPGGYYGAYTLSSSYSSSVPRSLTFTQRKAIVKTGRDLVAATHIGYPKPTPYDALDYEGSYFDGSVSDITKLRCDGVTEYCYEKNGHKVWWNTTTSSSTWNISNDTGVEAHNDMPDLSRDPHRELSPWAQRGSPPNTGPGSSPPHSHNTYLISDAVIDLPTYEVSYTAPGNYFVVTVKARDVKSGIHKIGYRLPGGSGWSYRRNVQHPTSDTYTQTFNVYSEGTFLYWAQDNGGNQPDYAKSLTLKFPDPTISGYVRTSSGTGISGVTVTFSNGGGTDTTDSNGYYSEKVPYSWSGTATPSKSGYTFSPSYKSYSNVTSNDSSENYTGTPPKPRISGYVLTSSGSPISGVTISFNNNGGTDTTDSNGYYSELVPYGWSGRATPSKSGYTFSPSYKDYNNLTSDDSSENYTGYPPSDPIISGYVRTSSGTGISGVVVTFSNSGGTDTTDSNGYYSEAVPYGWSGTATPNKSGYTFSPSSKSYSNVTSNDSSENYTGIPDPVYYTLSVSSSGASGVSISSSTGHSGVTNYTKTGLTSGTSVTLTAPATSGGMTFTGWTGAVTSSSQTVSLSMTANKSVTANYGQGSYMLTLSKTGNGSVKVNGTLRSLPWSGSFTSGTIVSLEAIPDADWRFANWLGTLLSGSTENPVYIEMNSSESVVANFVSENGSSTLTAWRYPQMDRIGHSCLTQGSTVRTSNTLMLQATISDVSSVLTGDVDNDGLLEIVTVSGSSMWIYAGNGTLKKTISLPRESFLAMLEDADGDGVLDIFLGSSGSGFSAYIYKGDGTLLKTFAGQHAGGSDVGMRPIAMSDGKVLVGYNAGYARTPRGVAAFDYATAAESWYYQIGPGCGSYSVTDMDSDGKLDITMNSATVHNGASGNGTTDGDMYLIVVDESGVGKLTQKYASPSNGHAYHVFADLMGNGTNEIIGFEGHDATYYQGQSQIHIFGTNGSIVRTFDGPNNNSWNGTYAVGDLDGDGQSEIVATAVPSLTTYVLDVNLDVLHQIEGTGKINLIADLNGDGSKEIVLLSETGQLSMFDHNLNLLSTYQAGTSGGQVIASDMTGDGKLELLCKTDQLYVLTMGIGLLGSESPDFNGDGKVDLLCRNRSMGVYKTVIMDAMQSEIILGGNSDMMITGVADFNGDGQTDILWETVSTGANYVTLMNGSTRGSFQYIANSTGYNVVDIGDFNGDGKSDLLWELTSTGANFVTLMNGGTRGSFQYIANSKGYDPVDIGDFNGDGKADLLWELTSTGANFVTLMNGGIRGPFMYIANSKGFDLNIIDLADFNGDGQTDLLWQRESAGANYVTPMNGVVRSPFQYIANSKGYDPVDIGDFNGDGKSDLLWELTSTGANFVTLMNGGSRSPFYYIPGSNDTNLQMIGLQ